MDQGYSVDLYYGYEESDYGVSLEFEVVDPRVAVDSDKIIERIAEALDVATDDYRFNSNYCSLELPESLVARIKEDAVREFLSGKDRDDVVEEKNTKIYFDYADAGNNKAHNQAVIYGVLTPEQKQLILDSLHEGEFFIPGVVGLDVELPWEYDPQEDHPFWRLDESSFEETTKKPTVQISAEEFVAAFVANKDKWEALGAEYAISMDPDYLDDVITAAYGKSGNSGDYLSGKENEMGEL